MNLDIVKNELHYYADLLDVEVSSILKKQSPAKKGTPVYNIIRTICISRHYNHREESSNTTVENRSSHLHQWRYERKDAYLPNKINILHYYIDLLRMNDAEERSKEHSFSCVRALNNVIRIMKVSRKNRIYKEDFSKLDFGNIVFNGIYWSNNGKSPCSFSQCLLNEYNFRRGHSKDITVIEWSTDGKYVLTGSNDWSAAIWNAELGLIVHMLNGHDYPIDKGLFVDNRYCITQCRHYIKIWEVNTGICVRTIEKKWLYEDQISLDGLYLYRHYESLRHRLSFSNAIRITEIFTGRTIAVINRNIMAMTTKGKRPLFDTTDYCLDKPCFTVSQDNEICAIHNGFAIWIYNIKKRKYIASPNDIVELVWTTPPFFVRREHYFNADQCLVFSSKGDLLLLQLSGMSAVLKISHTELRTQLIFRDNLNFDKGFFSKNEKYCMLVASKQDNRIIVWDCDSSEKVLSIKLDGEISACGFTNDCFIWVWYSSNHVYYYEKWDIENKSRIQCFPFYTNEGYLPHTRVSPDGSKLIIGFSNGALHCFDLALGQNRYWENNFFRNRLGGIVFSKHGETGLFLDYPKDIKIWNTKKRKFIRTDELKKTLKFPNNRLQNEDSLEYGIRVHQQEAYYNVPNDREREIIALYLNKYLINNVKQDSDVKPCVKLKFYDHILSWHTRTIWLGNPQKAYYRRRRWARRMLGFPEPGYQDVFYSGKKLCIHADGYCIHISDSKAPKSDIKRLEVKFDWKRNLHLLGWALPYCTIETLDAVTIWKLNCLTCQTPPAELYDTIYLCHQLYIDNCDFSRVNATNRLDILKKILYQYGGVIDGFEVEQQ